MEVAQRHGDAGVENKYPSTTWGGAAALHYDLLVGTQGIGAVNDELKHHPELGQGERRVAVH